MLKLQGDFQKDKRLELRIRQDGRKAGNAGTGKSCYKNGIHENNS